MISSTLRKTMLTRPPGWAVGASSRLGARMRTMHTASMASKPSRTLLATTSSSPLREMNGTRIMTIPGALYGNRRGMWAEAEKKDFLKSRKQEMNKSLQSFQKLLQDFREDAATKQGELSSLLQARANSAEESVKTAASTMNEEIDLLENTVLTDDSSQGLDGLFLARDILAVAIASSERQLEQDLSHARRILSSSDPAIQSHLKLKWIGAANGEEGVGGGEASSSFFPSSSSIATMSYGMSQATGELPVELSTIEAEERAMYGGGKGASASDLPLTSHLVKAIHRDAQSLHRRLKDRSKPYPDMTSKEAMVLDEVMQEVEDGPASYPDIHPYAKEFSSSSSSSSATAKEQSHTSAL